MHNIPEIYLCANNNKMFTIITQNISIKYSNFLFTSIVINNKDRLLIFIDSISLTNYKKLRALQWTQA